LRRLYFDPITSSQDWNLILAPQGGIMGVSSTSLSKPIKRRNFDLPDSDFEDAETYAEWRFVYAPPGSFRPRPGLNATP
jgi:hypothetical protein